MKTILAKACLMAGVILLSQFLSDMPVLSALKTGPSFSSAFNPNADENDAGTLADVARKESERRKRLEQQGIEGKVIDADAVIKSSSGNLTVSTVSGTESEDSTVQNNKSEKRSSIRSYRNALKKLDRTIRKAKDDLARLREQFRKARWAPLKIGRRSNSGKSEEKQNRMQAEIEELESELRELRRERSEIFNEGRRAGFLPGELDGKGIIP
jgi:predicted RNase H-like nuclease (RuvC/YqgF family)